MSFSISTTKKDDINDGYSKISITGNNIKDFMDLKAPYAFVDGSFNNKTKVYGFGGFIVKSIDKTKDKIVMKDVHFLEGSGDDPEMASMRNVAGEIFGAYAAVKKAIELGLKEINIYYDYMGVEKWATGEWKRNKDGTKNYHKFIKSVKDVIKINFIKVKAHSGIVGNEWADLLAKKSVGLVSEYITYNDVIFSEFRDAITEALSSKTSTNNNMNELLCQIIDIFEDFLDSKNVEIENDEREGDNDEAIIYGSDFDELKASLSELMTNWSIKIE